MKKTKIILTAICLALVLGLSIIPAMAYFTDYTQAEGSVKVDLGFETTMDEQVDGFVKTITISNAGPESCWVRARGYSGDGISLSYEGKNWSEGKDGWWYYKPVLDGGKTTDTLKVNISDMPENAKEGDRIDVTVVYETTKVLYAEDGTPLDPDWSMKGIEGGAE